jgi:SAM-dependent methyltransferase
VESLYDLPQVYDAAFGLRDFEAETHFLLERCTAHGAAMIQTPRSWLELACGPGRHTRCAAFDHGVTVAVGLDLSDAMVRYAQEQTALDAQEQSSTASALPLFIRGDMCTAASDARVAQAGPYDVICLLLGSLSHVTHLKDAAQLFSSTRALLSPGGVFVLELNHPAHLFDGSVTKAARSNSSGDVEVPGWTAHDSVTGRPCDVLWGAPGDAFDPVHQLLCRTVQVHVHEPELFHRSVVPTRLYTAGEVELLATGAGLRIAAVYGDLDVSVSANDPHAERLVVVLTHARTDDSSR